MNNETVTRSRRSLWKRLTGWPFVIILLLYGLCLCIPGHLYARAGRLTLFYLDFRHWPKWYSIDLWLLALGTLVIPFCRGHRTALALKRFFIPKTTINTKESCYRFLLSKSDAYYLTVCIAAVMVILFFQCSIWGHAAVIFVLTIFMDVGQFFYRMIYVPFYYRPLIEFMSNGSITWRLFVTPVTAVLLIAVMLYLNAHLRKSPGKHGKNKDEGRKII